MMAAVRAAWITSASKPISSEIDRMAVSCQELVFPSPLGVDASRGSISLVSMAL